MSDEEFNIPPPEAEGDDRPSDNEDALDDTADAFQPGAGGDDSDDESLLSEVDEAQFADFDPSAVAPDFETLNKSIKIGKRKRAEGDGDARPKKKERTREKPKKSRRRKDDSDDGFEGGEEIEGKRQRKAKALVSKERKRRAPTQVDINEESLDPEERRRRTLDRAIDAAVKGRSQRRLKKGDIVRSCD